MPKKKASFIRTAEVVICPAFAKIRNVCVATANVWCGWQQLPARTWLQYGGVENGYHLSASWFGACCSMWRISDLGDQAKNGGLSMLAA